MSGTLPRPRLRGTLSLLVLAAVVMLSSCLPAKAAAGRDTPVRRVAIVGDSLTHSLFGATPSAHDPIRANLFPLGISSTFLGFPGDSVYAPWPGKPGWESLIRTEVTTNNPDVIVIQSINFPESLTANHDAEYLKRIGKIFDVAQSRGAHVYIVAHKTGNNVPRRAEYERSARLQAQAAAGRGIETIPLNWWLDHCDNPQIGDQVHLTEDGVRCYADAIGAAVRQLRNDVG